jgi:hypothetical protein
LAHNRFLDAISAATHVACAVGGSSSNSDNELAWEFAFKAEKSAQTWLLRDVVGNPFHPPRKKPAGLSATLRDLACAAYQERMLPSGELDPVRLAVVADA